jgi:hypothetical protein
MGRGMSCGALLLGPTIVFLIVGGVGFYLLSRTVHDDPKLFSPPMISASTTETLLLGFANPRLPRDEAFALDLPQKTLRELMPPANWRLSTQARQGIRLEPLVTPDVFRLQSDDGWNVVLRTRTGIPYEDPVFIGFFDHDHAGIVAHTDERVLLSVSRIGEIQVISKLSEQQSVRLVQSGAAWIVRFTPGEGIENANQGPSTLTRLTREGVSTTIAQSPGTIARIVPWLGGAEVYAYGTEEGTFTAVSGKTRWQGTGVPLLWTDRSTLVYVQGRTLFKREAMTSTAEKLTDVATIPTMIVVSSTEQGLW